MAGNADRGSVAEASVVVLVLLLAWWGGLLYVDGALAAALPYHQYSIVTLLYPEVYYPGLPGWILASVQPFSVGVYVALVGWIVVLSVGIGALAARYAAMYGRSPSVTAAAAVVAMFVVFTVVEAAATLLA